MRLGYLSDTRFAISSHVAPPSGIAAMASRHNWSGSGKFCAAFGCSNCQKRHPRLHFYRFPKDEMRYLHRDT